MSSAPARDAPGRPGGSGGPRSSRLPSSDELFRRTGPREHANSGAGIRVLESAPDSAPDSAPESTAATAAGSTASTADRRPTGRERHDEKITVYVSNDELIDLEHARLTLKRLGVKADRGRIVREALAELIADLERNREDAVLVRRLRAE